MGFFMGFFAALGGMMLAGIVSALIYNYIKKKT